MPQIEAAGHHQPANASHGWCVEIVGKSGGDVCSSEALQLAASSAHDNGWKHDGRGSTGWAPTQEGPLCYKMYYWFYEKLEPEGVT